MTRKTAIFLCAGFLVLALGLAARQVMILPLPKPPGLLGATGWAKIYIRENVRQNYSRASVQAHDGGFLVSGESGQENNFKPWLMKLDSDGGIQWIRGVNVAISRMARTPDGKYVALATLGSGNSSDVIVAKFAESGAVDWAYAYGGSGEDSGATIQSTKDGGYIVTATSASFSGKTSKDAWLLKLSSSGGVEWGWSIGGSADESGGFVTETPDGGYFLATETYSFTQGGNDNWLLKLDGSGVIQWQKTIGAAWSESPSSVVVAPDGGYLISGWTNTVTQSADAWLMRISSSGTVIWQKSFGGEWGEGTKAVIPTDDGNYMVIGNESSWPISGGGYWTFKISPAGDILWQRSHTSLSLDTCLKTFDGGFFMTGIRGINTVNAVRDILVYKISPTGDFISSCNLTKSTSAQINVTSWALKDTAGAQTATNVTGAPASLTLTSDATMTVRDPCLTYVEVPGAPTGLGLETKVNRGIFKGEVINKLTWGSVSTNPRVTIGGYRIYRKLAGQSDSAYQRIGQVATCEYEDRMQTRPEKYLYAVTAVSTDSVEGPMSAPVGN